MNLYDEAIKELQDYITEFGMDYYATNHFPKTIKALERAKEHELLGLYREFMTNMSGVVKGDIQPKDIDERMVYLGNRIDKLEEEMK